MRCPVCAERAPEGANFCPACGTPLRADTAFVNEADACEAAAFAFEEAEAAREAFDSLSDLGPDAVAEVEGAYDAADGEEPYAAAVPASEPTTVLSQIPVGPTLPVIVRAEAPEAPEVEPQPPIEVAETTAWPAAAARRLQDDDGRADGSSSATEG